MKTTVPLEEVYNLVRSEVPAWDKDRYMSPDIVKVKNLLKSEKVWKAVSGHMDTYDQSQVIIPRPAPV